MAPSSPLQWPVSGRKVFPGVRTALYGLRRGSNRKGTRLGVPFCQWPVSVGKVFPGLGCQNVVVRALQGLRSGLNQILSKVS
jgi:hypothetical protein